jgi:hypothetical protein
MGVESRTVERIIARIASRAHGIVTKVELLHAGVTRRETERRLEKGLLIPIYRGVYRVGHYAPSVDASFTAAVKACGEGAASADARLATCSGSSNGGHRGQK